MDYQGNVLGATSTTAGVLILPNTGGVPILTIVGVAAIVTGITAILVQLVVSVYSRKNS